MSPARAAGRGATGGRGRRGAAASTMQAPERPTLSLTPARAASRRPHKAPTIYSPVSEPARGRKKSRAQSRANLRGRRAGRGPPQGAPLSPSSEDVVVSASTGGTSDASTGDGDLHEPAHARLETYIKTQARRLRYPLAFLDAYETEGWRKESREKIKPSKELENARRKVVMGKRVVLDSLRELQALNAGDEQLLHLTGPGPEVSVAPEEIYCSRCRSTETCDDNDILLCDNAGCYRAYHQQCQSPVVKTSEIPDGDELWYCEVCLAVFNCLKVINSAFGTAYENVSQVFPELPSEEREGLIGCGSARAQIGTEEEDDEQGDEDFVVDEGDEGDDDEDEAIDEDEADDRRESEEGQAEPDPVTSVSDRVSDDELQYLSKDDVIDSHCRSTRSRRSGASAAATTSLRGSFVGREVSKLDSDSGVAVMGVVMEQITASTPTWRVVYRDDTMQLLKEEQLQAAMRAAAERELAGDQDGADGVDDSNQEVLIVHGKRKRNTVNYRALNDLLFAGREDSDAEGGDADDGDEYQDESPGDADEDDEDFLAPDSSAAVSSGLGKRARRQRSVVDYRAMHEGSV